ncbi:MAG: FmdB family zinc ribbon protein [Actinomycetota bacterium]
MPVFGYKCTACEAREDAIVLPGEDPPTRCSACGKATLKRTWSGRLHVSLEGWGFSKTDSYLPDNRPRRDFKQLKERAERLTDE